MKNSLGYETRKISLLG